MPYSLLTAELNRRQANPSNTDPAPSEAVQELHDYLKNGGDPLRVDGFLEAMCRLGYTPKSTDSLCAEKYDAWCLQCGNNPPLIDSAQLSQDHEAQVRLLRYGEFLDFLEERDLSPPSEWEFKELDQQLECSNEDSTSPLKWEDDLTEDQIKVYARNILFPFVLYVNKNLMRNLGGQNARDGALAITESDLLEQCQETEALYREGNSVLGSHCNGSSHKMHMQQTYSGMTEAISDHFSCQWTGAVGRFLVVWANMMVAAAQADQAIAASIMDNPKRLIQLRQQALYAALALEQDEERPEWALDTWWDAYQALTRLLFCPVAAFRLKRESRLYEFSSASLIDESTPQGKAVPEYYQDCLEPLIWKSFQSQHITERFYTVESAPPALSLFGADVSIHFIKPEKWEIIRSLTVDQEPPKGLNKRQQRRFDVAAESLVQKTMELLHALVQKGMTVKQSGLVAPGSLVRKLISRGIMEVFTEVAESNHQAAAVSAVDGLAQLSRAKDCRLILLQSQSGMRLIQKTLQSKDLRKISRLLLLMTHLLWDKEWQEALAEMQNPSLEHTVIHCAGAAMKIIRETAYSMRNHSQGREHLVQEYAHTVNEYGTMEAKVALRNMVDSARAWKRLETQENRNEEPQGLLARALILMSTMSESQMDPDRLVRAHSLQLVGCCIDVPIYDVHGACVAHLNKVMGRTQRTLQPSEFPNPLHIVVSICRLIERIEATNVGAERAGRIYALATRLWAEENWKPIFQEASEIDKDFEYIITKLFPMISLGNQDFARGAVHRSCLGLTGKLRQCFACGKMEHKKGDYKHCSRCEVACYCSRDCQLEHWKKHKKSCKKAKQKCELVD